VLDNKAVNKLQNAKNLLAFSGGVDSGALFYLLVSCGVSFDLAIVDYGVRRQSILEVEYAKELALQYNKKIFIACAPKFQGSFEKSARDFRYAF